MRSAATTQPHVRDQILAVAETCFRDFGYAKTTVADIAKACGMSPANVYRFFESKAAIHSALTELVMARSEAIAQALVHGAAPASERLQQLLLQTHEFCVDQLLQDSKVHEIVVKAMVEQWPVVDAHILRMRAMVRELVADGVRSGEFQARDAGTAADCVNNAMMPFCHPQIVAERFAQDQGRQARAMGQFLVCALKAGGL